MKELLSNLGLALSAIGLVFISINCGFSWVVAYIFDPAFREITVQRNFWKFSDVFAGGFINRARYYSWALISEEWAQNNYGVSRKVFRKKANWFIVLSCWANLISLYVGLILLGAFLLLPSLLADIPPVVSISFSLLFTLECFLIVRINKFFDAEWKGKETLPALQLATRSYFSPWQSTKRAFRYINAATSEKASQKIFGVSQREFGGTRFYAKSMCWLAKIDYYALYGIFLWLFIRDIAKRVFS